ncbi:MAG: hypothetical protein ABEH77_09995 [Halobacteriaceae archaeon]
MSAACTYCGSDVFDHDPVFVAEGEERADAGRFCNYACLARHIDEKELETGACCTVDLG